jgi:REP element-mobilizing transposase RayT
VRHVVRPAHDARHPVHVTLRAKHVVKTLRTRMGMELVRRILVGQRRKPYRARFRILQFTLQRDHLHLIVEGPDLRAGISGFAIAFARRLNAMLGRRGKVWDSRYHRRDLESPRAVRTALRYVLFNFKKHGIVDSDVEVIDPFSSVFLFDGWTRPLRFVETEPWPKVRPRTWLLAVGWRRLGLLRYDEAPAAKKHLGLSRSRTTRCRDRGVPQGQGSAGAFDGARRGASGRRYGLSTVSS